MVGALDDHDIKPSRIMASVDFEAVGKRYGYLNVPCSSNESAWGAVRVPIIVIRNGEGPTVLLTGGSHGDEYEGPIALMKLARSVEAESISGRVIIIPALNYPAVVAGTRVSPIDGLNMNRAFPGRQDGTVTEMIADFVQRYLLLMTDAVLDVHSGGKTMMFSPFAAIHRLEDKHLQERCMAAMLAFGAPTSLVLLELDNQGMLDTAAEEMGKVFVSTELGGGGSADRDHVAIADIGVRNFLAHFGIIDEKPTTREERGLPPTRIMDMPGRSCFVIADDAGLYEPLVRIGEDVTEGAPVGQIHCVAHPDRPPTVHRTGRSGTVIGRHYSGLCKEGDCLAAVAIDYAGD